MWSCMGCEQLERRRLFSGPSIYLAPVSIRTAARAFINAPVSQVVANAGNGLQNAQQTPSPAMLDIIWAHEGNSLCVYPDTEGHPTIGVGLNLDDANDATAALAQAGLSYTTIMADWNDTVALWTSTKHSMATLTNKAGSPWYTFIKQHPSVTDPVMTAAQETQVLIAAIQQHVSDAASFVGDQFWMLDEDPQIALVDIDFNVTDITEYTNLQAAIVGDANGATDYATAAKEIEGLIPARVADDQKLMLHGEYFSKVVITPSSASIAPDQTTALSAAAEGAHGKKVILPTGQSLVWYSSDPSVATVTHKEGVVTGVAAGTTSVDADFNLYPQSKGTARITVTSSTPTPPTVPPPPPKNAAINGNWSGIMNEPEDYPGDHNQYSFVFSFYAVGSSVSGTAQEAGKSSTWSISGTINGNSISFTALEEPEDFPYLFTGLVSGNSMSGSVSDELGTGGSFSLQRD